MISQLFQHRVAGQDLGDGLGILDQTEAGPVAGMREDGPDFEQERGLVTLGGKEAIRKGGGDRGRRAEADQPTVRPDDPELVDQFDRLVLGHAFRNPGLFFSDRTHDPPHHALRAETVTT